MTMKNEVSNQAATDWAQGANWKMSPAQRVLCKFGDRTESGARELSGTRNLILAWHGYQFFVRPGSAGYAIMSLRSSSRDVIEIQSLISYPDQRGYGTEMLTKLCDLVDVYEVQVWLNAEPYGMNRKQIPLSKLREVYMRFGFFSIIQPQPQWLSGYHRLARCKFQNVMLRNPLNRQIAA